jgi:hypothetical protein
MAVPIDGALGDAPAPAAPAPEPSATGWYSGDAQSAEPAPEAPGADAPAGVPDRYELALEGVNLDPTMLSAAEPVLRELGLSNDGANKLLPVADKLVRTAQDRIMQDMIDAGSQQKKDWFAAYNADPVIGGPHRAETQRLAEKGMATLGFAAGHPFRQLLTESGLGNHPDMIRTFRRLGELVGIDAHNERSAAGARLPGQGWYGKGQG